MCLGRADAAAGGGVKRSRNSLVEMKVSQLTVDPFTNMPIIVLRDAEGAEALPIWIGMIEASAIATELEKIALDRPMTHDLMRNIIGQCGIKVERVEVHDVRDNTFYAAIHLVGPGPKERRTVDARPSDAIALALRTGAPICVAKKVLERTRRLEFGGLELLAEPTSDLTDDGAGPLEGTPLEGLLERLSDDEFGKWKM
jgi:bifunctional DNase/RNase